VEGNSVRPQEIKKFPFEKASDTHDFLNVEGIASEQYVVDSGGDDDF